MLKRSITFTAILAAGLLVSPAAFAQDTSPTLILETGPSDTPGYRRTIFIKYLNGERVNVNYRTETRSEFRQVPDSTPQSVITKCSRGPATSLSELRRYEKNEAKLKRRGQPPEIHVFCIKNVSDWERRNRDLYLDPIFNGMPLAPN